MVVHSAGNSTVQYHGASVGKDAEVFAGSKCWRVSCGIAAMCDSIAVVVRRVRGGNTLPHLPLPKLHPRQTSIGQAIIKR